MMSLISKMTFVYFLIGALFFFGCQSNFSSSQPESGSILAEIPLFVDNSYVMKTVEIKTLTNVSLLEGPAAKFYFMPSIDPNGELRGISPQPKLFKSKSGTVVAGDLKSLELLTLYYHFEQLMLMDTELGVLHLNSWPRRVGVQARVLDKNQKLSSNNARYSGTLDAYLFDSFIRPDLQLTINGGVIAHEHFHSIFYKLVLLPLANLISPTSPHETQTSQTSKLEETQNVYLSNLLRAWNEGLADVWGWAYSKDTNFVQRSIGFEKTRDLKIKPGPLPSQRDFQLLMKTAHDNATKLGISYQLGSSVARAIFQISERLSSNLVTKAIVRLLPKLTQHVKSNHNPAPALILVLLSREPEYKSKCQEIIDLIPDEDFENSSDKRALCQT
jgi:hypothetical protein